MSPLSLCIASQRNSHPLRRPLSRQKYASHEHTLILGTLETNRERAVGWGSVQQEPAFGGPADNTSVKSKVINLIASVRTLMRSTLPFFVAFWLPWR